MNKFKLPDLGEGLPDAIIREWYVKAGDTVIVDQPLVAMETAKALVDVPSPMAGVVEKLFGQVGDTIVVGEPLVGFVGSAEENKKTDSGTVVGAIETSETILQEMPTGVMTSSIQRADNIKATPAVRALARRLGVDLSILTPIGERITVQQVEMAAKQSIPDNLIKLSPVRRAMSLGMSQSHANVVPVTLSDDADIEAWYATQDITLRLLRAIVHAIKVEPMLNSYFYSEKEAYQLNTQVNIGIAIDTPHGLYVPVLKEVEQQTDQQLRQGIDNFKQQAQNKTIRPSDLQGATIVLSNFGALAGKYANPIITPPMVAIIGVGRARDGVVSNAQRQPVVHRVLPLSITIDHRLATGGEAARFLRAMIDSLS